MRGWGYRAAVIFTFVGIACATTPSTALAADDPAQTPTQAPKHKTQEEEIEESKAALAASHEQNAPALERGTPPYKPSIMPWVLGGVGIAAMITGGVFVLISLGDKSKADDFEKLGNARTNPNEQADLFAQAKKADDSASTNQLIGIIAGGAGVALLGAGIVWALVDGPPKADEKKAKVRPFVGPGIAGGTLTYAF